MMPSPELGLVVQDDPKTAKEGATTEPHLSGELPFLPSEDSNGRLPDGPAQPAAGAIPSESTLMKALSVAPCNKSGMTVSFALQSHQEECRNCRGNSASAIGSFLGQRACLIQDLHNKRTHMAATPAAWSGILHGGARALNTLNSMTDQSQGNRTGSEGAVTAAQAALIFSQNRGTRGLLCLGCGAAACPAVRGG